MQRVSQPAAPMPNLACSCPSLAAWRAPELREQLKCLRPGPLPSSHLTVCPSCTGRIGTARLFKTWNFGTWNMELSKPGTWNFQTWNMELFIPGTWNFAKPGTWNFQTWTFETRTFRKDMCKTGVKPLPKPICHHLEHPEAQ